MKIQRKHAVAAGAIALLVIVVVVRLVTTTSGTEARRQNIPLVKTEKPLRGSITYTLQFTGDVVAIQQAGIYAKVGGTLDRVFVEMGTGVGRGQMLALIDTTELFQTRQQLAATAQNARLNYARSKDLFEQNLVSKQDLDNAEAAMKVGSAALDVATTRLDYAKVSAPFGGVVTKRFLDPGAAVNPMATTLFTLMDLDEMKIIVNVLEKDIPRVAIGREATVSVDAFPQKTFTGHVTRFSQAVDLSTRTMAVEIDIPNRDHMLRPGMFANVILDVGDRNDALTLPTQALSKDDRGAFVFAAVQDTARKVRIGAGIEQNSRTEILSGLSGSEDVITIGQQFVKDGGPVNVQH